MAPLTPPRAGVQLRLSSWGTGAAGPLLIALCPLIVLHGFWLGGQLTNQHVDLLSFWLPRWCFLGSSLADGHLPTWLPYQFAGVPFASDPQSGWLYVPAMTLFSTMSCARALGVLIALNPVLAGLGLYAFFRQEGLGRPAATVGGLTLGLAIAGSVVSLSMPFAGTLAWTAVALAGASGFLHAGRTATAVPWLGLTAFALSQVAAAHLTHGLVIATLVVGLYVTARSVVQVRARGRPGRAALARRVVLFASVPILAAAVFVPRLALVPRTPLGHGYTELTRLTAELSGPLPRPMLADVGLSPWWGTSFARGPGGYVGAVAILLLAAALWSRRWRLPAGAFTLAGVAGWLLNLDALVGNERVRDLALRSGLGELWLRDPARLRYLPLLAFAALAGYGVQAWLDLAPVAGARAILRRAIRVVPPLLVFTVAPLAAGSPAARYALFFIGAGVAVPLLLWATAGRVWAVVALPALVAVELTAAGLIPLMSGLPPPLGPSRGEPQEAFGHAFGQLRRPNVDPTAYLTPGPIGRTLIAEDDRGHRHRYLTFDPDVARSWRGFLTQQSPAAWPAYENGRSILFGIEEVQGYSPVQLERYWRLVRAANPAPILYNAATFQVESKELRQLLAVGWVISRSPRAVSGFIAREGGFDLFREGGTSSRVSFVTRWRRLDADAALQAVLEPGFDGTTEAIVEDEPALDGRTLTAGTLREGSATYEELSPNHVRIRVTADVPGLIVVRNAFDRNWRAAVDGQEAAVFVADYLMQGVAVPAGTHTVDLRYRDDAIGYGLVVSGVSWSALVAVLGWLLFRESRRKEIAPPANEIRTTVEPSTP